MAYWITRQEAPEYLGRVNAAEEFLAEELLAGVRS